jgi:hypothetical protein
MLDAASKDDVALAALAEMGTSKKLAGYRPRAVRVHDARLAGRLRDALTDLAIPVDVVGRGCLPSARSSTRWRTRWSRRRSPPRSTRPA